MLRPQYTRRPFEIMLIGPPNSGKRTISKKFLECPNVFYSINIAESIPKTTIPRVDYILIMIDMTNRDSLDLLSQVLSQIEPSYLTHKLAVVLTKVDMPNRWGMEREEVDELVAPYKDLQLFYVNLTNNTEKKSIINQISRLIKINSFQYQNLDIDYIKSIENFDVDPVNESENSVDENLSQLSLSK